MRDKEINGGWDLKFLVGYYVGRVMFYYEKMGDGRKMYYEDLERNN